MTGALILLGLLLLVGLLLKLLDRPEQPDEVPDAPAEAPEGECCGLHAVCEKGFTRVSAEPAYYDDEELDAYAGRPADGYSDAEVEQFRDVMLTLRPSEVRPWATALECRHVNLPDCLRDELLMLIADA